MLKTVEGERYRLCAEASKNMWCANKPGDFGPGCINTDKDPCKAQRVGLITETGFGEVIGMVPDYSYKPLGIHYDFLYNGLKIDVKGVSRPDEENGHIQCVTEKGYQRPLTCNYYVFGTLMREDRHKDFAEILLRGFISKEEVIATYNQVPSTVGPWKNYKVALDRLHPMKEFINACIH